MLPSVLESAYVWYMLFFLSVFSLLYQLSSSRKMFRTPYHGTFGILLNARKILKSFVHREMMKVDIVLKKSRLRIGGRFLDLGGLIVISLLFGVGAGIFSYRLLDNWFAAVLLSVVGFSLPLRVIAWDASFRRRMIIKQTPYFFLTLANFYQANGDVIPALDESSRVLKSPLGSELSWMLRQIKFGFPLGEVISMMKKRLDSKILQDFLDDLEIHTRHGSDFRHIISSYIDMAIEKETARMERQSETFGTVYVVYFLFAIYLFMLYTMIQFQPQAMSLLTTHFAGKLVVVGMIVITMLVFSFVHVMVRNEDD